MIPTLIELGPVPIRTFGLMVALGLVVGALRLSKSFVAYGIDPALAERYVMVGGISGLLGARLWFLAENWSYVKHDFFAAAFASAGFTFYGGFIIAAIAVFIAAKRDGTPVASLCDALGPCLALGYAVGRIGCQLSGDGDYGIPTTGFWGMSFATGVVPTPPGQLVYPAPVFESFLSVLVAWGLGVIETKPTVLARPLQRFGLYLILISMERFVVEFVRPNPEFMAGLSEAQVIAIVLSALGVAFAAFGLPSRYGRATA